MRTADEWSVVIKAESTKHVEQGMAYRFGAMWGLAEMIAADMKSLEQQLERRKDYVDPADLPAIMDEYASDCQVSQRVRIDPCSWLQKQGYLPSEAVKPCRGEMEAQVGQPAHERLAQMVKDIAGMKV